MGKLQDLTGKRFGRLLVLYRVPNKVHFTARWNCKCDCGKEKEVDASNLRGGYTKSCGCLNNETRASRFRLRPYENAYNRLCYNAKNRNILVELTYEEYLEFTKILNCHYCDNELIWTKWANKDSKPRTNLDRKDKYWIH